MSQRPFQIALAKVWRMALPNDLAAIDWVAIGLVLTLIGCLLLGNALLVRSPRLLVEELFGVRKLRLLAIRAAILQRVHVAFGFTYVLIGLAVQIAARSGVSERAPAQDFPAFWVGCITLLSIALLLAGWWWSAHSFRAHVREYFRAHPPELEVEMALAREIGELFGVRAQSDDTVSSYAERVRVRLGLPLFDRDRRRTLTSAQPAETESDDGGL